MPNFRRNWLPGGTFFFTVVTAGRAPIFREGPARALLGTCFRRERAARPFDVDAIVLLPRSPPHPLDLAAGGLRLRDPVVGDQVEVHPRVAGGWRGRARRSAGPEGPGASRRLAGSDVRAHHPGRRRPDPTRRLHPLQPGQAWPSNVPERVVLVVVPAFRPPGRLPDRLGLLPAWPGPSIRRHRHRLHRMSKCRVGLALPIITVRSSPSATRPIGTAGQALPYGRWTRPSKNLPGRPPNRYNGTCPAGWSGGVGRANPGP